MMAYIRIKRIKGSEYAYLVEAKWYKRKAKGKSKGPRQTVLKYLGKVHPFSVQDEVDFYGFMAIQDPAEYVKEVGKHQVLLDLISWELSRHHVPRAELIIDFKKKIIHNQQGKEVSLKFHEGLLNTYTLRRLFNPKQGDSYYLAKMFVEAGIEIPQEVFVLLYAPEIVQQIE